MNKKKRNHKRLKEKEIRKGRNKDKLIQSYSEGFELININKELGITRKKDLIHKR